MGLVIGALVVFLAASVPLTTEAASDSVKKDRINKVLDAYIKGSDGTPHGEAVKKIKEKFNRDGTLP